MEREHLESGIGQLSTGLGDGETRLSSRVRPVLETIASHPDSPVNYVFTPKNAASSIKATLLRANGYPHEAFGRIFCSGAIDVSKPFLVVSRNPFDRIVSAYLNKIGKGKDDNVWLPFCERYGVSPDSNPTFAEFLKVLRDEQFPHKMDIHFRPQFYTNNFSHLRPYLTASVEDLSDVAQFFKQNGYDLLEEKPHATNAKDWRGVLEIQHVRDILSIYRIDFESYGYDEDKGSTYVPPSQYQEQMVSRELTLAAKLRGAVDVDAFFRYTLEVVDTGNVEVAVKLMQSVLDLDPKNEKLETEIARHSARLPAIDLDVLTVLLKDHIALRESSAVQAKDRSGSNDDGRHRKRGTNLSLSLGGRLVTLIGRKVGWYD